VLRGDIPGWLDTADIFLNTTNIDNTPVSLIEAMAAGLCIVSTNVGGIPYLLEDGVDALLVPPGDPRAMANAIQRILTDPRLPQKLSSNARRKAEGFSWQVVYPMWENLISDLLLESLEK
jgi:glycosyltransferase involved in cell wall biosynthesis